MSLFFFLLNQTIKINALCFFLRDKYLILQPQKSIIVKVKESFNIPVQGIKDGMHEYIYKIDQEFFDEFEFSEIENGFIKVILNIEKQGNTITCNFSFEGEVSITCDRCLDSFMIPIAGDFYLILKIMPGISEMQEDLEDENVLHVPDNINEINIAQYLYEYFHLYLPMVRNHSEEKGQVCNQEMVKILREHQNKEKIESSDPRWEALKNVKIDN